MDVFVARQPILTKQKKLYGYELLFRTGMDNAYPQLDGDTATSSLLSSSFFSGDIDKISGGRQAFINFTETLLLKGTPAMFPLEKIVVEVLEDVKPTEDVIHACRKLKRKGYTLALDDFEYSDDFKPLLSIADIVKVDFILTPPEAIDDMLHHLQNFSCKLLAEKIETYEEFDRAVELGFSLFQGYFFSKPEVLKNKDISSAKLTVLQLISEINTIEFDVAALEKLINQDVAISYKLLKYLNSVYFSRLSPLKSIRQAVAYLGERGVMLFVSLIAASQLAENKPEELVRVSIIRARFLELIGTELNRDSGEMFLLGLFSLIDAMLDNSMEYLVDQLPLSDEVCNALVHKTGALAQYLHFIQSYETGNWETFTDIKNSFGIEDEKITRFYLDAIGWADSY